ncbi:MAG: YidC/Oxa1 family membrane protein insertase [bacterium]
MYNTLIYQPILNSLLWLYQVTGQNLGFAIIFLTLIIRGILIPFTLPQLKSAKKMAQLKPELDALKKKYGHDNKLFQQKQVEFYKTHGVNPAAGCLPFIAQFIVLIALYQVFMHTLGGNGMGEINTSFFLWDLKVKDTTFILPVLAGILQLVTSLAILPAVENEPEKRQGSVEDKKDVADMATSLQQQMVFMMPIMTVIFSLQFPSGLALYWVVTTAFSLVQQLIVSGPGAILTYAYKFKLLKKGK